ncbi:MAG: translation initiation factor IF-2 [Planctomycetes bacterium]|nr:translation initiation factor IF-2 [Planctomycetota bacterium]NBY02083.1 translation initiation factor IF-2 [Planctomycetota bacterium]
MQKEKIRIYVLAKELDVDCKDLIALCHRLGFDIKNQLSSLEPAQREQVETIISKGGLNTAGIAVSGTPTPSAPITAIPTVIAPTKPPTISKPSTIKKEPASSKTPKVVEPTTKAPEPKTVAPKIEVPVPEVPVSKTDSVPVTTEEPDASEVANSKETPVSSVPTIRNMRMRNLDAAPRPGAGDPGLRRVKSKTPQRPTSVHFATPPVLKPKPVEEKKLPPVPTGPRKIGEIPKDLVGKGGGPIRFEDIKRQVTLNQQAGAFQPQMPVIPFDDDEEEIKGKSKGGKRPGGVAGRSDRHREREVRKKNDIAIPRVTSLSGLLDQEELEQQRIVRERRRQKTLKGPQPRKGKVPIEVPITVRALSEALGIKSGELLMKLMGAGLTAGLNINSIVEPDYAATIALESGCELEIKRKEDLEEKIISDSGKDDAPEDLILRAPIVTIMGHVDHGKTSLLDKIRKSEIAASEAGGITQCIRAWRVEHNGKPITFLDTPGHEAFTKMRARGANVTDIAVIVVAADDGVMPQTEEAISHAKAANVKIIVAINKVDLPNANIRKTEQQLYGQGLIPDTMGGDVQFVQTSAATGKGINELLDNISLVAEVEEFKSNPNKTAKGVCLEANVSEGEGVFATVIVQDGTLKKGDVILCGSGYGRVRMMYDDMGKPIAQAGPSIPCKITGLDELPNADDVFVVISDLAEAREIAEKRKMRSLESSIYKRSPMTLETLSLNKVTELKVILKADFRGSIEAIRKELEKFTHEEVAVRVLHTGVGGITESDVQLALASPDDTIIVGFNSVPDDRARSLAEEKGIQIRQYNIIYKLAEDVRNALEGKLKPREDIIHLGRAVVRDCFKISRVGTIAGCYVTQGTIERSAKVRLIRNGVVIYPPPDKNVGLESLKRFKEDVREVREGFECGIKILNYDDIKVDDVIEAYKVEQVLRTLS